MTGKLILTMVIAAGVLVMVTVATAQEPILVNYQGTLADSTGNPVPDGNYSLLFMIYDDSTGGIMLWDEGHSSVQTVDGLFRVQLGSVHALDLATLGSEPLFLEIYVNSESLSPRMHLTQVPEAVYAQQLKGDIETEPGSFLFRSSTGDSAVVFRADGSMSTISVKATEPFDDRIVEISSSDVNSRITVNWMDPGDDEPQIEMLATNAESRFSVGWVQPPDAMPAIRLSCNNDGVAEFYMRDNNGDTAFDLMTDGIANTLKVNWTEPMDHPAVEISSGIGGDASIFMFNPQPEPPHDPLLEMLTGLTGGQFKMYSPQAGRTVVEAIEIVTSDSGGSMLFYDETGDHVWLSIDPDGSEGNMTFFNSYEFPTVNISSTGHVGITGLLWIEGPARSTGLWFPSAFYPDSSYIGTDGNYITFGHSGVSEDFIGYKNNTFYFKDCREGTEALDPDVVIGGEVGMGIDSPESALHVHNTDSYLGMLQIENANTGDNEASMAFIEGSDAAQSEYWVQGVGVWGNTNDFVIGRDSSLFLIEPTNGNVGIGTTSPLFKLDVEGEIRCYALHQSSDLRLKTDIETIDNALDKVSRMRGVSFKWRDNAPSKDEDTQIGVIAQEVEQVFPELVSTPENGYKSVDYTKLTAVLIEAVKELRAENQELREEISELRVAIK